MKIKHIETDNIISLTYKDWYDNYIKKGIYKNFEVVDYSGVVELQILQENGKMRKQPFDSSAAKSSQRQFSDKIFIQKKLSFETYDKWLVSKNHLDLRSSWYNLPRLKRSIERITNSTISKEVWLVARGVVTLLIAYSIWEYFK